MPSVRYKSKWMSLHMRLNQEKQRSLVQYWESQISIDNLDNTPKSENITLFFPCAFSRAITKAQLSYIESSYLTVCCRNEEARILLLQPIAVFFLPFGKENYFCRQELSIWRRRNGILKAHAPGSTMSLNEVNHSHSINYTVCPGSSDPFYIVTYYIKWVTTSWTHSMSKKSCSISYSD